MVDIDKVYITSVSQNASHLLLCNQRLPLDAAFSTPLVMFSARQLLQQSQQCLCCNCGCLAYVLLCMGYMIQILPLSQHIWRELWAHVIIQTMKTLLHCYAVPVPLLHQVHVCTTASPGYAGCLRLLPSTSGSKPGGFCKSQVETHL